VEQAFLLRENVDQPSSWIAQIDASREAYATLRNHFLKYIEHPDDLPSTTDPLAEDEEVRWKSFGTVDASFLIVSLQVSVASPTKGREQ
jgi:hypothetical protein